MINKVISGGQTGADISAVIVAKKYGLETGGWMPKGFITQAGPRPDYAKIYGMQEHSSPKYAPRTYANVKDSDGTLRIAGDLYSAGEICTMKAIEQYKKPHFDISLVEVAPWKERAESVLTWLAENDILVLNVAGNTEKTFPGTAGEVLDFMEVLFQEMGLEPHQGG